MRNNPNIPTDPGALEIDRLESLAKRDPEACFEELSRYLDPEIMVEEIIERNASYIAERVLGDIAEENR